MSTGLFHRVISQSGHPLDMEKPGVARQHAWKMASFVGCDDKTTSKDLLACLKKLPAEKLVENNSRLFVSSEHTCIFHEGFEKFPVTQISLHVTESRSFITHPTLGTGYRK